MATTNKKAVKSAASAQGKTAKKYTVEKLQANCRQLFGVSTSLSNRPPAISFHPFLSPRFNMRFHFLNGISTRHSISRSGECAC